MKLDSAQHTNSLITQLDEISHDLLETSSWKVTERIELELKKMSLLHQLAYIKNA